jgi:hypothetical protein
MPLALATMVLVIVVLLVAATLFAVKLTRGSAGSGPPPTPLASPSVVHDTIDVPSAVLAAIAAPGPPTVTAPSALAGSKPLRSGGMPLVVYVGAEYCPFCAAERWALVEALSRFGSFSDLGATSSAADLVFPSVASFSFRGASYQSRTVAFAATETYSTTTSSGGAFVPLEPLSAIDRALLHRFDAPPLAPAAGALPFVDIGGIEAVVGAQFSPGVLSGLSSATVAGDLSDPTSPVAIAVDGAANEIAAAICEATGNLPATVCGSSATRKAQDRLRASAGSPLH